MLQNTISQRRSTGTTCKWRCLTTEMICHNIFLKKTLKKCKKKKKVSIRVKKHLITKVAYMIHQGTNFLEKYKSARGENNHAYWDLLCINLSQMFLFSFILTQCLSFLLGKPLALIELLHYSQIAVSEFSKSLSSYIFKVNMK